MTVTRPSKPRARSCSAARSPPSEAPTTTTCGVLTSALDEDGLDGADIRGLLDLGATGLVGDLLVLELPLVVHPEHGGRGDRALPVVLAEVEVDDDLHGGDVLV